MKKVSNNPNIEVIEKYQMINNLICKPYNWGLIVVAVLICSFTEGGILSSPNIEFSTLLDREMTSFPSLRVAFHLIGITQVFLFLLFVLSLVLRKAAGDKVDNTISKFKQMFIAGLLMQMTMIFGLDIDLAYCLGSYFVKPLSVFCVLIMLKEMLNTIFILEQEQ